MYINYPYKIIERKDRKEDREQRGSVNDNLDKIKGRCEWQKCVI